MRYKFIFMLALLIGLCLSDCLPIMAQSVKTEEITSLRQLQQVLSSTQLRSDEVEELSIKPEGIPVDTVVVVHAGNYRMKGGALIRAKEHKRPLLKLEKGATLTIENTIDGANIENSQPLIDIEEGANLILNEKGVLQNNHGMEHALVVINFGTFQLNGGTITQNVGSANHVIFNGGELYLASGKIIDNQSEGSVYSSGETRLNPQTVTLNGSDLGMFVGKSYPIGLLAPLNYPLTLSTGMKEGGVVAYGIQTAALFYDLQPSDIANIKIASKENLSVKLVDNQAVLYSNSDAVPDEITTEEELQAAIDRSNGTSDNPTKLKIAEAGIRLTKTIDVKDKCVQLTGGTITCALFETYSPHILFTIENGTVVLENITIDGACTADDLFTMGFRIRTGSLIMNKGTVLSGFGLTSDLSIVWLIDGGKFIMNDGLITSNKFDLDRGRLSMASLVSVSEGQFIMNGGRITGNTGDYSLISTLSPASFIWNGGDIEGNNDCYIRSVGDFRIGSGAGKLGQPVMLYANESFVLLGQSLKSPLQIGYINNDIKHIKDGSIIVKGDNYNLTEADREKVQMPNGITTELINNAIVARISGSDSEIDSASELQAAIDAAATGNTDSPTELVIAQEFTIASTIKIDGKHIKLTGKTIKAGAIPGTNYARMFEVTNGGSLTLEKITLDGTFGHGSSFVKVDKTSSLILLLQAVLQNGTSIEDWYALDIAGSFVMKGGFIRQNKSIRSAIIYLSETSKWTCTGGNIESNNAVVDNQAYSIVQMMGQATIESAEIHSNNGIAVLCIGTLTVGRSGWLGNMCAIALSGKGVVNMNLGGLADPVYYMCESGENYLALQTKLTSTLEINVLSPQEGYLIAKGSGYTLTKEDVDKIALMGSLNKEWSLKLVDNTIVLTKKTATEIDTQEKLQAAINASKGTADAPETITVASKGISITSPIQIKDKYVILTGGTLTNGSKSGLRMFNVQSGYLGLKKIKLDGNLTKTSGYCTFIYMSGGTCELLDEETILTRSRGGGGYNSLISIPNGKVIMKDGHITNNKSDGGDLIWVSGNGHFSMQDGAISSSGNIGRYIMSGIEITGGSMNLTGGTMVDLQGNRYGIYADKDFTLGGGTRMSEVIILNNNAKILLSSALESTVTIGFMKSNMPSGTVVASGTGNYRLTSNDVKRIRYRFSNSYDFELSGNNIVIKNLSAAGKNFTIKTSVTGNKLGTIKADKSTAKENETVKVTVTPDKNCYLYSLRFNNTRDLTMTSANVHTFRMPPANVTVTAQFMPQNVLLRPVGIIDVMGGKPVPTRPNGTTLKPDTTIYIPDLDGLIDAFSPKDPEGTTTIIPEATIPEYDKPEGPIADEIEDGERDGDDYIGSLEELISVLDKDKAGKTVRKQVLYRLPTKIGLRIFLPDRLIVSEELRASGTVNYYILNQCEDKVTKIIPSYDPVDNALTFETDKMGVFVVMNARSTTANEAISNHSDPRFYTADGNIVIRDMKIGDRYAVYNMSGRMLKSGIVTGNTTYFSPEVSGYYVVSCGSASAIVYFSK